MNNMAQYIDKEALVAEIEKHFNGYTSSILKHYDACKEAKAQELGKILTIINTLEVKEVDFETAFAASIDHFDEKNNYGRWSESDLRDFAKHFFELGLQMKGE